jgi:SnoaL-like protein
LREEVVMLDAKSVAGECLKAWTDGDFDTARSLIDEEITFAGPFGTAQGADAYLEGLRRFRDRGVETAEVQRAFQDGDEACLIYNLVTNTPAGTIPSAGWYQLRDGRIVSVRAFFDARPLAPRSIEGQR